MQSFIVMITERCNMSCACCAVSAGPAGRDMDMDTFKRVCERIREVPRLKKVCLSGGEPTLHPLFWEFVDMALGKMGHVLQITTNGSVTESALKLADMGRKGILEARLSLTEYHNRSMVSPEVVKAYESNLHDLRTVGTGTLISLSGRAAVNQISNGLPVCFWDLGWLIDAAGHIFNCGCRRDRHGSVWDDENILLQDQPPCSTFENSHVVIDKMVNQIILNLRGQGKTGMAALQEIYTKGPDILRLRRE